MSSPFQHLLVVWILAIILYVDRMSYRAKMRLHDMHADTHQGIVTRTAIVGVHVKVILLDMAPTQILHLLTKILQSFRCPSTWMPMTMGATGLDLLPSVLIPQRQTTRSRRSL